MWAPVESRNKGSGFNVTRLRAASPRISEKGASILHEAMVWGGESGMNHGDTRFMAQINLYSVRPLETSNTR